MKKILVIIDPQYDFINGSLGVKGAEEKMVMLADYIRNNYKDYESIILSADFHPVTHCSFKNNGGTWPIHCMQHSHGAAIFQPILDAIEETGIDFQVLTKGLNEDREEYSVMRNDKSSKTIHALVDAFGFEGADFCGIADIYCVKDSIEDFHREFPNIKINVLIDFIGFMNEKKFNEFLEKSDYVEVIH